MRTYPVVLLVLAGTPPGGSASVRDPDRDVTTERVAGLIKQLGDPKFARREAAFKELVAIGEPALEALRKASDSSDAEVRTRAERAVGSITARACERELAKMDGYWRTADAVWLKIDGQRWASATPTWGPSGGTMWIVEVGRSFVAADMLVEFGPNKGQTCQAIFKLEGDRLKCCSTYSGTRATEFKPLVGYYLFEFNRGKK
jgi:uncharacterized protein (TIGR03067 family)